MQPQTIPNTQTAGTWIFKDHNKILECRGTKGIVSLAYRLLWPVTHNRTIDSTILAHPETLLGTRLLNIIIFNAVNYSVPDFLREFICT